MVAPAERYNRRLSWRGSSLRCGGGRRVRGAGRELPFITEWRRARRPSGLSGGGLAAPGRAHAFSPLCSPLFARNDLICICHTGKPQHKPAGPQLSAERESRLRNLQEAPLCCLSTSAGAHCWLPSVRSARSIGARRSSKVGGPLELGEMAANPIRRALRRRRPIGSTGARLDSHTMGQFWSKAKAKHLQPQCNTCGPPTQTRLPCSLSGHCGRTRGG